MKKFLIYLLCINSLLAQTVNQDNNNDANMKKYWYYRTKLNNDFVKVGSMETGQPYFSDMGESQPFNQRAFTATDNNFTSNNLKVGDGLSTLGIYIGVLATEYRLLANNHQNTQKVVHELACALSAVNRIDAEAEYVIRDIHAYSASLNANNLNGFLIRSDMPQDFLKNKTNYDHFNYFNGWDGSLNGFPSDPNGFDYNSYTPGTNPSDRGFASMAHSGQWFASSEYEVFQQGGSVAWIQLPFSQDHAISLLFGLSLVKSLVDNVKDEPNPFYNTVCLNPYDPGYPFVKDAAQRIADRLVNYIGKVSNWKIKEPTTGTYIGNLGDEGGDATAYSYALAEIGCITGIRNAVSTENCTPCTFPITSCGYYHDAFTKTTGNIAWQGVSNTPGTTPDIAVQVAELSTACNCLYTDVAGHIATFITQVLTKVWKWLGLLFGWLTELLTTITHYLIPEAIFNVTNDGMQANVARWNLEYAPFARRIIHNDLNERGTTPETYYPNMELLLTSAPCEGPWNLTKLYTQNGNIFGYTENYPGDGEWSSDTRVEHPERRKHGYMNGKQHDIFTGEYNGLDYMLYFNLWKLYSDYYITHSNYDMIDLSDRLVTDNFPLANGKGSDSNPIEIDAFETIIVNGSLAANSNVTFQPGKTLVISGPNFHAAPGQIHFAAPKPFNCGTNYYPAGLNARHANDTTVAAIDTSTKKNYTDIAVVKTHYVDYNAEVLSNRPNSPITTTNNTAIKSRLNSKSPTMEAALIKSIAGSILEEIDLDVLPNPNNGIFKLKLPNSINYNTMTAWIYDMSGKLIVTKENLKKWPDTESINMEIDEPGTYHVRILTDTGKHYASKIEIR